MIRVSFIDSDIRFCNGLKSMFNQDSGIKCIGIHTSYDDAIASFPKEKPDIILMDVDIQNGLPGVCAIRVFRKKLPDAGIIILTNNIEVQTICLSFLKGAFGYLKKNSPADEILKGIRAVYNGSSAIDPEINRSYLESISRVQEEYKLSWRLLVLLDLICRAKKNKQIAECLHISQDGVKSLINRLYKQLHVNSRIEAVVKAMSCYSYLFALQQIHVAH